MLMFSLMCVCYSNCNFAQFGMSQLFNVIIFFYSPVSNFSFKKCEQPQYIRILPIKIVEVLKNIRYSL